MGVLDDAIREHLELKRKHGVAEEEVQRQQEEALGPARRDVAQQHGDEADQPLDAAADAQETALFDGEDAPAEQAEPVAEQAEPAEPTPGEPPPVEPPPTEVAPPDLHPTEVAPPEPDLAQPSSADPDVPALSEEPPVAGQPPVGQEPDIGSHAPTEPADEPDARDVRLGDTQPHGFDAVDEDEDHDQDEDPDEAADEEDDLLLSDPEAEDQDVLEDTPDFLQETPEHDRLWFEQKPPRDFDFD